jgi:hypothetical protein
VDLKPIADYIDGLGIAQSGHDMFVNAYPAAETQGILIRPMLAGAEVDHELPGYIKFDFQVIVRGHKYVDVQGLGVDIAKALNLKGGTLGDWTVNYIRPRKHPVSFPLGDGRQTENNTVYSACIVDPQWE